MHTSLKPRAYHSPQQNVLAIGVSHLISVRVTTWSVQSQIAKLELLPSTIDILEVLRLARVKNSVYTDNISAQDSSVQAVVCVCVRARTRVCVCRGYLTCSCS